MASILWQRRNFSSSKPTIHIAPKDKKTFEPPKASSVEEKLSIVKAYRQAKGLCYKCDVKWNPSHKCVAFVSLYVLKELWQLIPDTDSVLFSIQLPSEDFDEDLCAIPLQVINGTSLLKQFD